MTRGGKTRTEPAGPKEVIYTAKKPVPSVYRSAKWTGSCGLFGNGRINYPLYACGVSAGFPSPADDYLEGALDLNTHLVREPNATFFVRANGESMIGAGIHDGDLLVVDRSARVTDGKVVIVALNGELTVKRFRKEKEKSWLMPENPKFKPILLNEQDDTHLWGVVTSVIHSL